MKRIQRFIFGSELTIGQKLMVMGYFFSYGLIVLTVHNGFAGLEYEYMHSLLKVIIAICFLMVLFPVYCIPLLAGCYRWARQRNQWGLFYALPWALHILFAINLCLFDNLHRSLLIPKGADPETVEILWDGYIKDKSHVWHDCREMTCADASSFRNLGYGYACDDKQAYYISYILDGADPSTFAPVGRSFAKDKDNCYVLGIKVHAEDPASFKVFLSEYDATMDLQIWCIDRENIYWVQFFLWEDATIKTIRTEDYEGFHVLKDEHYYAADRNHIYAGGAILEGADVESFHVVDQERIIGKDKRRVYYKEYPRDLDDYSAECWISGENFYLDGNRLLYRNLQPMPAGTDPKTIHRVGRYYYSADCKRVYWGAEVVEGANPEQFVSVSYSSIYEQTTYPKYTRYYGKDDQHVFYMDSLLVDADVASFQVLEDDSAGIRVVFDRNRIYEGQMTDAVQEYLNSSRTLPQ